MTKRDYRILYAYYAVEVILFLAVKVSEILQVGRPLDFIRYSTIACNFIMIIYLYNRHGRGFLWRDNLIPLAFTLTLAADTFMCVIKGNFIPVGYFLFALVETVYMLYLKPTAKNLAVRLILYVATLPVLWCVKKLTIPNAIAMVNMVQLFVNVICAWIRRAEIKNREVLLFALGITLFFGCDFSILIRTVTPEKLAIHKIVVYVVWTCYIPAQVLLLSSYVEKLRSAVND